MAKLAGEVVFSANRGYLGYERWGFTAPYLGIYDPLQIEQYGMEYEEHVPDTCVKFFPMQYWAHLRVRNACPLLLDWPRKSSRDFSNSPDHMYVGYSVTYMLLQVAAMMGCNPIILIGMDHRYPLNKKNGLVRLARLGGRWLARKYDGSAWYRCGEAAWREYFKLRENTWPCRRRACGRRTTRARRPISIPATPQKNGSSSCRGRRIPRRTTVVPLTGRNRTECRF